MATFKDVPACEENCFYVELAFFQLHYKSISSCSGLSGEELLVTGLNKRNLHREVSPLLPKVGPN